MNLHTWMRTCSFCCLQVTMTNVYLPFGRRTKVIWTPYWITSSLMLKSPRRIFWSPCLLWVPGRLVSNWHKMFFLMAVVGEKVTDLALWINNVLHLPLTLIWRHFPVREKTILSCMYVILHRNSNRDSAYKCLLLPYCSCHHNRSFKIWSEEPSWHICLSAWIMPYEHRFMSQLHHLWSRSLWMS